MLGSLLQQLVGAALWLLANAVYYDMRRKGQRNFGRFAAFWVGTPTTWITFFAVREGRQPTFDAIDDEALLFAEVRRDRALRSPSGEGSSTPPGESGED